MANIYTPNQQRILLITSLLVIGGFIIFGISHYITAFLGAVILYVVLRPWFHNLVHKRGWNRRLVTILLIVFSILVIILPFLGLSLLLADRIQFYSQNPEPILKLVDRVEKLTNFKITDEKNIRSMIQQSASFASRQFPSVLGGALDFLLIMGLLFVTMYFMFMDEEAFMKGLRKYLPFKTDTLNNLGQELKNMVNANVLGQALVSFVQAMITGITLWIFGVPDPAFWGMVTFFFAFIPVLGSPIVWVPAGIIQISSGNTGQGVGILIVGAVVIVNIDNLLRIWLAKRMGDVHPLITLVGIVLGVPIFGILGLVIGPLLLSYFVVLMKVFERENRSLRTEAARDEEQVEKKAKNDN